MINLLLTIVALICFGFAVFGKTIYSLNLVALGLFCLTFIMVLEGLSIGVR